MRIWLINHYAISPAKAGGTRHFTLARELVRRGHVVTIFASAFDHGIRRSMPFGFLKLWKTETTDGVRFVWLRTPGYRGNTLGRVLNMGVFAAMLWFSSLITFISHIPL